MKKLIFTIFFMVSALALWCQKSAGGSTMDTTMVLQMNSQSNALIDKNTSQALSIAEAALKLSQNIRYTRGEIMSYNNIGWAYYRRNEFTKSFDNSLKALKLNEEIGDIKQRGVSFMNIAAVYNGQNNYNKSIEYFLLALNLSKELGDTLTISRALNNIAYTYLKDKKLDEALNFANQANEIIRKHQSPSSYTLRMLGDIWLAKNNKQLARQYFEKSYAEAVQLKNNFLIITNLNRLGKVAALNNDAGKSLQYFQQAIAIGEPQGFRDELDQAYLGAANAFHALKMDTSAFATLKKYQVLHDSIYNETTIKKIAELQAVYENERKETEISFLKKQQLADSKSLIKQRQLSGLLVAGVFLLIATASIYYLRNKDRKLANAALEKRQLELDKKNKAIEKQREELTVLTHELQATSLLKDKVFSIIAHDLRSPLASLSGTMNLLDKDAISMDEFLQIRFHLNKQLHALNSTLENLLHWSKSQIDGNSTIDKRPIELNVIANNAINLLQSNAEQKQIQINNKIETSAMAVADADHIDIVMRNLLSNAIKFTPNGGTITLSSEELINSQIKINITDTGLGIESDSIEKLFTVNNHFTRYGTNREKGTGIGLMVCKEFIAKNDGTIGAISTIGKGSNFYFILSQV